MRRLAVIGGSWGGLEALGVVLQRVKADIDMAFAVALHRHPESSTRAMHGYLAARCGLAMDEPGDKTPIEPSTVYLAPADYHLLVDGPEFALSVDEPVRYSRPSIDVLFESAAVSWGPKVVAVVLTGANDDGKVGLDAVKRAGGITVVQTVETADRWEMPEAAMEVGPHLVLPLTEIGELMNDLVP